jgi:hypothetical protein
MVERICPNLSDAVICYNINPNCIGCFWNDKLKEKAKALIELKQKQAKIKIRMDMIKMAAREGFWTLPEDEQKRILKQEENNV